MRPDLATAHAAMLALADTATGDSALGWRHAAQVVRLFKDARRALTQLRQLASFWHPTSADKATAYREAAKLITRHTGEQLPRTVIPEPDYQPTLEFALS